MFVLTQGFPALRRSPHPPQCAHWGTFPRGKAWDVGSESFRHGFAVPPPFDKGGCWTGILWVHTLTAGR